MYDRVENYLGIDDPRVLALKTSIISIYINNTCLTSVNDVGAYIMRSNLWRKKNLQ